jgi:Fic family protein
MFHSFRPVFRITPTITKALMAIEADRQAIIDLPMTSQVLQSLRESARLLSTHYSTQIEGNRLTEAQVKEVIEGGGRFPGRERDEAEVRNYFRALEFIEVQARKGVTVSEMIIQRIHGLTYQGRPTPTAYRDGQNVIRNPMSGGIVYMPPEAKDVGRLMEQLVYWINASVMQDELPIPIIAALGHYQFATIHPYYDGNGRTARLLTTFILHRYGYGLKGIYALEAYYARKLEDYYNALDVGEGHNYYVGNRAEADVTGFIEYFVRGMADSFAKVREQASKQKSLGQRDQSSVLRNLSPAQRQALELFRERVEINAKDVAKLFNISQRQASRYCQQWVEQGFLIVSDSAKKSRRYRLISEYESLFS